MNPTLTAITVHEGRRIMKTLIFNGSPRANGNTSFLVEQLASRLEGEISIINAYKADVEPCRDCRYCWEHAGCCINDEMQEIYQYIRECDNIIIASPLNFSELTGKLLALLSRLQMFYASRRFIKINQLIKKKKGAIIITDGGEGGPGCAMSTAKLLLGTMNAESVGAALCLNTDAIHARFDYKALKQIDSIAAALNKTAL